MRARALLKDWVPPWVVRRLNGLLGRSLRFSGRYGSWQDAVRASQGYDAAAILERVAAATRKVVAGEARYERDSVLFNDRVYPFEILCVLLREAMLEHGKLDVLDFGGALGSTYRQCRPFLDGVKKIHWHVVEQAAFARLGLAEFATPELDFSETIGAGGATEGGGVVLLSSVLQYLEHPHKVLDNLIGTGRRFVIIDRTPLAGASEDRLCVQHSPKSIYPASYPCWILSRAKLLNRFGEGWRLLGEFGSAEGACQTMDGFGFGFGGMIFERKT